MLNFDWFLLEWVGSSKIDEKTFTGTLSCRHKPIKPSCESLAAPQDEANVWKKLNIKIIPMIMPSEKQFCTGFSVFTWPRKGYVEKEILASIVVLS